MLLDVLLASAVRVLFLYNNFYLPVSIAGVGVHADGATDITMATNFIIILQYLLCQMAHSRPRKCATKVTQQFSTPQKRDLAT